MIQFKNLLDPSIETVARTLISNILITDLTLKTRGDLSQ